jgi:LuxR family maltose regulon positive regulatory protein
MTEGPTDRRFDIPFLAAPHLSRPRLLDRLDEAAPAGLTVLSAGAGAGKTVLLGEWAHRQRAPVAWLALSGSDDDPARFWRLFLAAGRAAGQLFPASSWTPGGTVELVDSVLGRPAEPVNRLVMVLDDIHLLTDPEILVGLDRIVRRWSHRVRLVVAARSDPLLPLHRYRLAGQMQELRGAELAMSTAEARQLLGQHGVALPDEALQDLMSRTEGWSAGLRLAALRMAGAEQPAEFIAQPAMDEGSIGEYLTEEVLAVLPPPAQDLLIATSFLDDVSGPLAEAVTGIADCRSILTSLARTNSFVIPTDPARTTFRCHHLFREMLRQLALAQPAGVQEARYARAAGWYRQHGDLPSALRWSVRAGDAAGARSVLAHGGLAEAFIARQEPATADLIKLAQVPRPSAATPAELLEFDVTQRAILAVVTSPATAADVPEAPADGIDPLAVDPDLAVTALLAEVMLGQKSGVFLAVDAAAGRLLSEELRTAVDGVRGLRAWVLMAQAGARFNAGRLPDVDALLRRALSAARTDGTATAELQALSMFALLGIHVGRRRHADSAIAGAEALLARHPGLERPVMLHLAVARRAYVDADLATMAGAMRQVHAAGPIHADVGLAAVVAFVQATLLAAVGELGRARILLRDHPAVSRMAVGLFGVLRDRELAAIETALGRPRSALQTLRRHRGTPEALIAEVAVARAYLALGDLDRAGASVRAVTTTPSPFVDRPLLVDAALCEAEIAHRRGDEGRATELLARALQIAAGEIVLPFVQATGALKAVLIRHRALTSLWPAPVAAGTRPDPRAPGRPGTRVDPPAPRLDPLPDALTHRERAVLQLITTSMSTAEIAEELCLSVNTVKTHLAAIYRKLSVGRRREAVFRARELELL